MSPAKTNVLRTLQIGSIILAAGALTACGGGEDAQQGSAGATVPPAAAPGTGTPATPADAGTPVTPAPTPTPDPTPTPTPKTWKDADCSATANAMPGCSINFSDNYATAEVVNEGGQPAIRLSTGTSTLAPTKSRNNDVSGNKAVYGLDFLHKVKLADFPGVSLTMKLDPGNTIPDDAYVTYTISRTCDGNGWMNLITTAGNMRSTVIDADGYATYKASPHDARWAKTGSTAFPPYLNGVLGSGGPLSLDALIAAYPDACLYNYPHPSGGVTPAVVVNLGDSGTTTSKTSWLHNVMVADKQVFPPPPPAPAPVNWKDAICAASSNGLPGCTTNFSDNYATAEAVVESGLPAVRLRTGASMLAAVNSRNNGVPGNKAVYGINFLHKVRLADFPGLSFAMKLDAGSTIEDDAYVTYAISRTCDGNNWMNLITTAGNMKTSTVDANGYVTYTVSTHDAKWAKTGSTGFPPFLNGALGTGAPLSLDALIAAYPDACFYNFPHPSGGVTPAVVVNLGDSRTTTGKTSWIKGITVGDKTVF